MQNFTAGTQYNDYFGTAAADRSDSLSFDDLLYERGLINAGESVAGFEIVFNENSGKPIPDPGIVVFLGKGDGVDAVSANRQSDGTFRLRLVEVLDLPLADFFKYFKRFNLMFSNKSLKLDGAPYEQVEGW